MDVLRVALVDDEPLARERLSRLLREAGCEILAELEDGPSLLKWLSGNPKLDALFLDIQMPGGNGLELLADIPNPPPTIFVTAYSEYAVRAFEVSALDYLLKPIFSDRVEKALQKVRNHQVPQPSRERLEKALAADQPQRFTVKAGTGKIFLELKRVSHFELDDDILWAWCGGKRFRTQWTTLGEVESEFPNAGMIRIQRHLLLRPESVTGYQSLLAGRIKVRVWEGVELEVSRSSTPGLKQRLGVS